MRGILRASATSWFARTELVEPANVPAGIVESLRAKYPQYQEHALESRPMLTITIEHATRWSARD